MTLALLGFTTLALLAFVLWLLADGLRVHVARRRREAARRPLTLVVTARAEHTADLFTLTLARPGGAVVSRRYSLAAWSARPRAYSLGVRRVDGGLGSGWLHEHARPGLVIEALPPAGGFVLAATPREVVLVGGGIGITPLAAMVDALAARHGPHVRVWLFQAARRAAGLVGHDRHAALERAAPWFHYRPRLTRPESDWPGARGRLAAADLTRELAQPLQAAYYLCAGAAMMDELAAGLAALGVPAGHVHREAFGAQGNPDAAEYPVRVAGHGDYRFQGAPSLLHALEAWGVPIASDCRAGSCGACRVRVASGSLRACQPAGIALPADEALACCSVPAGEVAIRLVASGE